MKKQTVLSIMLLARLPIPGKSALSNTFSIEAQTGFIDDADKPAFYNLASVFVYPSLYEGFGFPALEALACGTPVIASNSSSLPEVVGDAGILVDLHRPDDLFRALEAVLLDRKLAESLWEKGRARAKRFSWDTAAKQVSKAFCGIENIASRSER